MSEPTLRGRMADALRAALREHEEPDGYGERSVFIAGTAREVAEWLADAILAAVPALARADDGLVTCPGCGREFVPYRDTRSGAHVKSTHRLGKEQG